LGIPANKETKQWRIKAHDAFDQLWKVKKVMSRKRCYAWMQEVMDMTPDEAHIGRFDIPQCQKLIDLVFKKIRKDLESEPDIEITGLG